MDVVRKHYVCRITEECDNLIGRERYLYLATTATDAYLMSLKALCADLESHKGIGTKKVAREMVETLFKPLLSESLQATVWLVVDDSVSSQRREQEVTRQLNRFVHMFSGCTQHGQGGIGWIHMAAFYGGFDMKETKMIDHFGTAVLPDHTQRIDIMKKILSLEKDKIDRHHIMKAHASVMADYSAFAPAKDIRRVFHEQYVPRLKDLAALGHFNVTLKALQTTADKSLEERIKDIVAIRTPVPLDRAPRVEVLQYQVRLKGIDPVYPFDLVTIHNLFDEQLKQELWQVMMHDVAYTWGAKGRLNSLMAYHTFEPISFPVRRARYIIGQADSDVTIVEQSPQFPPPLLEAVREVLQFMFRHQHHVIAEHLRRLPAGTKKYTIHVIVNAIATVIGTGKEAGYSFHNDVNLVITAANNESVGTVNLTNAEHMQSWTYTLFNPLYEDEPYAVAGYKYRFKDGNTWCSLEPLCGSKHRFRSNTLTMQGPGSQQRCPIVEHGVLVNPDGVGHQEDMSKLARLILNIKMAVMGNLCIESDTSRVGSLTGSQGNLENRVETYLGVGREDKGLVVNDYVMFDRSASDVLCSEEMEVKKGRSFQASGGQQQRGTQNLPDGEVQRARLKVQHRPSELPDSVFQLLKALCKEIRVPNLDRELFKTMDVAHKSEALVSSGDPLAEIITNGNTVRDLLFTEEVTVKEVVSLPDKETTRYVSHPSMDKGKPYKLGDRYSRKGVHESQGFTYSAGAEMRTHKFINGNQLENAILVLSQQYKNDVEVLALTKWVMKVRRELKLGRTIEEVTREVGPIPGTNNIAFSNSGTGGSGRPAGAAPLSMRKGSNDNGSFGHVVVLCNGQKPTSEGNQRLQEMARKNHVITYFVNIGTFFADDKEAMLDLAAIASVSVDEMSRSMVCLGRYVCREYKYSCPKPKVRNNQKDDAPEDQLTFNVSDFLEEDEEAGGVTEGGEKVAGKCPDGGAKAGPDESTVDNNSKRKEPIPDFLPIIIGQDAEAALEKYGWDGDYLNNGNFMFSLEPWLSLSQEIEMEHMFSDGRMDARPVVYADAHDKAPLEVPLPPSTCQKIVSNKAAYNIHMACYDFVRKKYYQRYTDVPRNGNSNAAAEEASGEENGNKPIAVAKGTTTIELTTAVFQMLRVTAFANASSAARYNGDNLSVVNGSLIAHPLRSDAFGSLLQVYGVITTTSRSDLHGAMNFSNAVVLGIINSPTEKNTPPFISRMRVDKRSDLERNEIKLWLQNVLLIRCTGCVTMLSLFRIIMAQPDMQQSEWKDINLAQMPPFGIPSINDSKLRELYRTVVRCTLHEGKCTAWVLNQHKSSLLRRFKRGFGDLFVNEFLTRTVVDFADGFIEWCDEALFGSSLQMPYDRIMQRITEFLENVDNDVGDMGFLAQSVFNDIRSVIWFSGLEEWTVMQDNEGIPRIKRQNNQTRSTRESRLPQYNKEILGNPQRVETAFGSSQYLTLLRTLTGQMKLSFHEIYDAYLEVLDGCNEHLLATIGIGRVIVTAANCRKHVYYLLLTGEILSVILFEHTPCYAYGVIKYRFPHFGMSSCPLSDKAHTYPVTIGHGSNRSLLNFDQFVPALGFFFKAVGSGFAEAVSDKHLSMPNIADHRPKNPNELPPDVKTVQQVLADLGAVPIKEADRILNIDDVRGIPTPVKDKGKRTRKRKRKQSHPSEDEAPVTKQNHPAGLLPREHHRRTRTNTNPVEELGNAFGPNGELLYFTTDSSDGEKATSNNNTDNESYHPSDDD